MLIHLRQLAYRHSLPQHLKPVYLEYKDHLHIIVVQHLQLLQETWTHGNLNTPHRLAHPIPPNHHRHHHRQGHPDHPTGHPLVQHPLPHLHLQPLQQTTVQAVTDHTLHSTTNSIPLCSQQSLQTYTRVEHHNLQGHTHQIIHTHRTDHTLMDHHHHRNHRTHRTHHTLHPMDHKLDIHHKDHHNTVLDHTGTHLDLVVHRHSTLTNLSIHQA
jgi:hypothetical protein